MVHTGQGKSPGSCPQPRLIGSFVHFFTHSFVWSLLRRPRALGIQRDPVGQYLPMGSSGLPGGRLLLEDTEMTLMREDGQTRPARWALGCEGSRLEPRKRKWRQGKEEGEVGGQGPFLSRPTSWLSPWGVTLPVAPQG